jgi:molybdate transport system substrate-binding protein
MNPFARLLSSLFACALAASSGITQADESRKPALLVFAAASLTNVLGELAPVWEKTSGIPVKLSFAASSVLARQIEAGSNVDVFISADQDWMNYLQARKLISQSSRANVVANRLVLIAPADSNIRLRISRGFRLADALGGGRLATGDPDTVPVGRYARSALMKLGVWSEVEDHLVGADNVRGAMTFVARGEAPLGIVYATDAQIDPKVRIVATFPDNSHGPITYPAAATATAGPGAAAFVVFLRSSKAALIWQRHGFLELAK